MLPPLVSVIIPVFDRQEAGIRAIESARRQSLDRIEIIVVDDASPVPFALTSEQQDDARISLLRCQANKGAAGARNVGIANANAPLIAFLDSDDTWQPAKLERQLDAWGTRPVDELFALATGFTHVGASGSPRVRIPVASARIMDFASGCWFCPGSTVLVTRNAFDVVGPLDERLRRLEDLDWFLRFAIAGGTLGVLPEPLVTISAGWRGRPGPVAAARDTILAKYAGDDFSAVASALRRYLSLELVVSHWAQGDWRGAAGRLFGDGFSALVGALRLQRLWRSAAG